MDDPGSIQMSIDVDPKTQAKAYRQLLNKASAQSQMDGLYANCLGIPSLPLQLFLKGAAPTAVLTMTSVNEDRLLQVMAVPRAERDQIEGLQSSGNVRSGIGLTLEQIASLAVARLAADPAPEVGSIQRRCSRYCLRPYPLGLRVSGNNLSPIPGWLAGAQSVCLNMSNVDLPLQLHFALFNGSSGFVLKPVQMLQEGSDKSSFKGSTRNSFGESGMRSARMQSENLEDDDDDQTDNYWPPARENLSRITIQVLSLHNLPKRSENRPRYEGPQGSCHKYVPTLSGSPAQPDNQDASNPGLRLAIYAIGGFCAIGDKLPLPAQHVQSEKYISPGRNGLMVPFGDKVHCITAEPHATFLRAGITDRGHEVAFEMAVLGRLRLGYRVLQLRNPLGTRIELACLFVRVSMGTEANLWVSPRQLRIQGSMAQARRTTIDEEVAQKLQPHLDEVEKLKQELSMLRETQTERPTTQTGRRT